MPRIRRATTDEITAAARRYQVKPRTIYRWLEKGLAADDLDNLEAVASFILRQRAPSSAAVKTITKELTHELETHC